MTTESGTFMTSWMGDERLPVRLWVQLRRFNQKGDVQRCHGRVTGKEFVDGERRVVWDVWAQNQRGEVTIPGRALVLLPSCEHGPVQLPASAQPAYPTWGPDTRVTPVGRNPLPSTSETHGFLFPGIRR